MAVVITQGQAQPWSSGLFDCFSDLGGCVLTCCFPCYTYGKNVEATYNGAKGCFGPCCCFVAVNALIGCPCLVTQSNRTEIRMKYGLQEQPCSDCCVHFWCLPCALCQESRELKKRPQVPWPPMQQVVVAAPMMVAAPVTVQGK